MSFDFDKFKRSEVDPSMGWNSYSDLFMNLSVIFLMLYVSVSLRSGTGEFQRTQEMQRLQAQTEDYKQQIKVYNTLNDQYLKEEASEDEQKVYAELIGKLNLLQETAKDEKENLLQQSQENEKKEFALNKYQQVIRNIINTNMLSKSRLKRRDETIVSKREEIKEQETTITDQEKQIIENKNLIAKNEEKIQDINNELDKKIEQLKKQQKKYRTSKKQLESKILALKEETEQQVSELQDESDKVNRELGQEKRKAASLEKDLSAMRATEEAKREVARKMKERFAKAGISAKIDPSTGDITIQFDKEYFDTGRADLKANMKKILQQSIPLYAKSLMEDKEIAKKLDSVEIIGFASPTYQGKYVDPKTLELKDKAAVNYNLDLSYKRAKSIFNYMTDTSQVKYEYQKELLPLIKVTGRSFLAEGKKSNQPEGGFKNQEEFCKAYNCNDAQRVIIKFNLKK
ncbi:MAG: hypothetical protein SGJ18_06050 [Pseudomonadota bacterium]|nr:hypothetical protein [Pseudomonadota bacterium]